MLAECLGVRLTTIDFSEISQQELQTFFFQLE
jgi:hypothetical protein